MLEAASCLGGAPSFEWQDDMLQAGHPCQCMTEARRLKRHDGRMAQVQHLKHASMQRVLEKS